MKQKIFLFVLVAGIVASSGFALTSNVVYAQGASMYAPGHQYNFTFRLRGVDRAIYSQTDMLLLLEDLIAYLQELRDKVEEIDDGDSEVEVTTHSAINITDDSATLRGEVDDFNRSDYATVWFEYGRSSSVFTTRTSTERINDSSDGEFSRTISRLRDDTEYYFRAVARDDEGRSDYGSTRHFTTDEVSQKTKPDVDTWSVTDITDDSATLRGAVDMNDFNNGRVFFVYGEDEDLVEGVSDEFDSYAEVDEQGEDLQKESVDYDLDYDDSYEEVVYSLDNDTEQYFSLCVEYEDEDGDDVINCGSVRSFTTDS